MIPAGFGRDFVVSPDCVREHHDHGRSKAQPEQASSGPIGLPCQIAIKADQAARQRGATPRRSTISGPIQQCVTSRSEDRHDRPRSGMHSITRIASSYPRLFRQASHHVEFVVRAHGGLTLAIRSTARRTPKSRQHPRCRRRLKAVAGDSGKILFGNPLRLDAHLHREVEHGSLAWSDIRPCGS